MEIKMKSKLSLIILAILIVVNLSAFATLTYKRYCKSYTNCQVSNDYRRGTILCQKLNLSNEQIQQIRELSCTFHEKADSISMVLSSKRAGMVDLLTAPNTDHVKIEIALSNISKLQADLQKHVIDYLLREKELLNQEQQEQFFHIIKNRLVQQTKHHQSGGLTFVEDSCNAACQDTINCLNKPNERE